MKKTGVDKIALVISFLIMAFGSKMSYGQIRTLFDNSGVQETHNISNQSHIEESISGGKLLNSNENSYKSKKKDLKKIVKSEKKDSLRKINGTGGFRFIYLILIILGIMGGIAIVFYRLLHDKKNVQESMRRHDGQILETHGEAPTVLVHNNKEECSNVKNENEDNPNVPTLQKPNKEEIGKINEKKTVDKINGFCEQDSDWTAVGVSVIGKSHIEMQKPCQDSNGYLHLRNGWAIAVVADGAGSAKLSQIGSKIAVDRALVHFETLIKEKKWTEQGVLPSDDEWKEASYLTLRKIYNEMRDFAKKKNIPSSDLHSTIIVVISSPLGLLTCHIGDGRAGYKNSSGEWLPLITPHKGEEANQTLFITSEFWENPFLKISGVSVPESRVVRDKVEAYTLLSDGCENTCWECNKYNNAANKYYDPNIPYSRFYEPITQSIAKGCGECTCYEILKSWHSFIKGENGQFQKETDDKTMIVAVAAK